MELELNPAGMGAMARVRDLFLPRSGDPPHVARGKRLLGFLLVVALAGVAAMATALVRGHRAMGTTSEMPWGILIATYVFFVALTSGLCMVSSLGHVFGFRTFEPLAKRAIFLALVTLVVGFSVIASELERPFLLVRMAVLSPNPASPIWWMGALYGLYLLLIAIELYLLLIENHRLARTAGVVSLVAAVAAHTNLGAVFGLSHSRPFWYGPLVPLFFMAWALACGAALLMLMVYFGDYFGPSRGLRAENEPVMQALRKLLAVFLLVIVVFNVWRLITGISGAHDHGFAVTLAILTGPLFVSFWLFETFLGLVVPLVILIGPKGRSPSWLAAAALLPMLGVFVMRMNFVYEGQMFSLKPVVGHLGERLTYSPPFKGNVAGFLSYTPSIVEVAIVAGAIAAAILLYSGGARLLRLAPPVVAVPPVAGEEA